MMSKIIKIFIFYLGLSIQSVWALGMPTIGEMHPPVVIAIEQQKTAVFFLKNNLRREDSSAALSYVEVFYSSIFANKPSFDYVWKIEADEIVSVFFYDWMSPEKKGKSMYVLVKNRLSSNDFKGVVYSAVEFPVIRSSQNLVVSFFQKDLPDPMLQTCHEGRNLINGEVINCAYKSAKDIKRYLAEQDK